MDNQEIEYVERLIPEVKEIKDPALRENVMKAFLIAWHRGKYTHIEDAMYQFGNVPLYQHSRVVARIAMASADALQEIHGVRFNRDHVIAAALLHDLDKWITTRVDKEGKKIRDNTYVHGFIQARIAQELGMPDEIANAVLLHSRERFTRDRPQTIEGLVVQDADILAMNPLIMLDKVHLHY